MTQLGPALPAATSAERAVGGSLLFNSEAIIAVADWLKPDHFFDELMARVYAAALACFRERVPVTLQTVAEELRRRGQLDEVGGLMGLVTLMENVMPSHITFYGQDIIKAYMRRQLITVGARICAMASSQTEGDLDTLITEAHALIDRATVATINPRFTPIRADALDQATYPEPVWAVPGLLPVGLTLLIGKPKMRKSWLALALAIAIASGGRALGTIPVEQGDVLYLALEDSERRLQSRQRKILSGSGAPDRLHYLTAAPRLDEGCVGLVENWLKRNPAARLIIIDVLAKVRPKQSRGGNMYDEDYAAIEPLQQLAQRKNLAILVVHHMNRSGAEDVYDMINGSSGIGGSADGLLTLAYERGQTDATLTISSREIEDDSALALRWDNTTAQWVCMGKAVEVKASNERQEIITCIREEKRAMGPKEMCDALGKAPHEYANVKQLMYRMARDGDLQGVDKGKYALPAMTLVSSEGDRGDRGDPKGDHRFSGVPMGQNGKGDRGDRNHEQKNRDHRDHLDHFSGFDASQSQEKGDRATITADHLSPFRGMSEAKWTEARDLWRLGDSFGLNRIAREHRVSYSDMLAAIKLVDGEGDDA